MIIKFFIFNIIIKEKKIFVIIEIIINKYKIDIIVIISILILIINKSYIL